MLSYRLFYLRIRLKEEMMNLYEGDKGGGGGVVPQPERLGSRGRDVE